MLFDIKRAKGYEPRELTEFERTIQDNWGRDPVTVWTAVRIRVAQAAEARKRDVDLCLIWAERMLDDIVKRKLSPFAVPYEIDQRMYLYGLL